MRPSNSKGTLPPGAEWTIAGARSICCSTYRLYSLLIFTALCVAPFRLIWRLVAQYDDALLIEFATEAVLPVQYALAILYFSTSHIQRFYGTVEKLTTGHHFECVVRQECVVNLKSIMMIAIMVQTFTLLGSMHFAHTYHTTNGAHNHVFFFVASRLFGRGVCTINMAIFAFVFYKHVKVLRLYASIIELTPWETQRYDKLSLVLIDLLRTKESLKVSTDALKPMFSFATIAGVVVVGAYVHNASVNHNTYDLTVALVTFGVMEVVLFAVIALLSKAKERIEDVTSSSLLAVKFLGRGAELPTLTTFEVAIDSASTLDYFLVTQILKEEWLDFSVCGLPLHKASFIKQAVTTVIVLLVAINTDSWLS